VKSKPRASIPSSSSEAEQGNAPRRRAIDIGQESPMPGGMEGNGQANRPSSNERVLACAPLLPLDILHALLYMF
jgi:hypothetical protein